MEKADIYLKMDDGIITTIPILVYLKKIKANNKLISIRMKKLFINEIDRLLKV